MKIEKDKANTNFRPNMSLSFAKITNTPIHRNLVSTIA